jgi:hypothetical protein
MMTRAQARTQRRALMKEIAREHRKQAREKLLHLRQELRDVRALRRSEMRQAKERCRAARLAVRAGARELRARVLAELRETIRRERAKAREMCAAGIAEARGIADRVESARAELHAERSYHRELRRLERANKERQREAKHASRRERRSESDDAVRANLPEELIPLWEKVKRSIRGSNHMSRTEAFLQYAEEHPAEVLQVLENRTEALIRDLEKKELEARRELRRGPPREVYADVTPF